MRYLPHILFCVLLVTYGCLASAQVYNKGAMYVPTGGNVAAFGDLVNEDTAIISNAGNLYALYNITNAGQTGYHGGTLYLWGQTAQILDGSIPFFTTNLEIKNIAGGITLSKRYSVSNEVHFISGILHAPLAQEPLEFNPGGDSSAAVAATGVSDTSHVEGYTSQLGTGNFIYPVGDSTRYQPIAANLSTNTGGMLCNYIPADAGIAPFLTTGLDNNPLLSYNPFEFWNLSPLDSAKGTVTIYYDGYNDFDIGANYDSTLKVAHHVPAGWANEGGIVNGTQDAGMISTTGEISGWNQFTLGSTISLLPLPTEVLDFTVLHDNCDAILSWNSGVETNMATFEVQYSTDGIRFKTIGSVPAQGSGSRYMYRYTPMNGRVYFRLAMRGGNGGYGYTQILMLNLNCKGNKRSITVYPNPVTYGNQLHISLSGYNGQVTGIVYDITGRQFYIEPLANGINSMEMDKIAVGTYQLCIVSAGSREVYKIVVTN